MEHKTLAYRQNITIENPQHLVLSNLPLKAGQKIEILILVKEDKSSVVNPAQSYTNIEWDKLDASTRSELETQYVLNNPVLMEQMRDKSEWITVPFEQLNIDLKD